MPPRKKSNSSSSSTSKKTTPNPKPNSQPSKYGIHHFFGRLSQNPKPCSNFLSSDPKGSKICEDGSNSGPIGGVLNGVGNGVVEEVGLASSDQHPSGSGVAKRVRVSMGVDQNPDSELGRSESGGNGSNTGLIGAVKNGDDDGIKEVGVAVCDQNPKNWLELKRGGSGIGASEKNRVCKNVGLFGVDCQKSQNPKNGLKSGFENTPPEHVVVDLTNSDDVLEVSPEVSKGFPRKRFKFSPGMLIKQSQDDQGEEVTWKISPVNERLQAISKLAPDVVKALADASRLNSSSFQQISDNSNWHSTEGEVHEEHSMSATEALGKSTSLLNGSVLKRMNDGHATNMDGHCGSAPDLKYSGGISAQNPFRTPPSLSYQQHEKPARSAVRSDSLRECVGLRQHKKALLELLDQVENAISTKGSDLVEHQLHPSGACNKTSDERTLKDNSTTNKVAMNAQDGANLQFSDPHFLVLEVTEKRATESAGAQCSLKALRILNERSGEEQSIHLWDDWFYSVIEPGDSVRVIGEFDNRGHCDVNHDNNLIIIHPNLLLSGTRVAGSFSCPRRAVLDERLKSGESSTAALTGTLLHQIFQAGLLMESPTIELLQDFANIVLQKNIEGLYACGVQEKDMRKTLYEAIPRLCNWIAHFRDSKISSAPTVDFGPNDGPIRVSICDVVDIEEMAWAPKYGLKGVIDASLRVQILRSSGETNETIMPLEFKTGKATSGQALTEHSAQLILYTLLLSERYMEKIDTGLLYYLSTDQTLGATVRRSDLIGLIMRRNELAHSIIKASKVQQLPPMLQIPNMCRNCRHLNACSIYHKVHGGNSESSGLGDLFESLTDHLTTTHKIFFKQWDHLIDLEAKEVQLLKFERGRSYLSKNENSCCLSSIVLDASDELHLRTYAKDDRFVYRFVHKNNLVSNKEVGNQDSHSSGNDLQSNLRSGDRVILSTESNYLAVASGIITDISRSHVSVSCLKRLRLPRSIVSSMSQDLYQEVWLIEKDEFASSFATMRYNLVQLFLLSAQSDRLRRLIVDLEAPRFDSGSILSQDPAISYIWSEKNLNADQRRAIIKILTAKDYALILGMPGTGKTSTMVYAVKALLMRGASVLLTSYTNSAVDNLLIKLKTQVLSNGFQAKHQRVLSVFMYELSQAAKFELSRYDLASGHPAYQLLQLAFDVTKDSKEITVEIDFVRIGRCEVVHKEIQGHCLSDMNFHSVEEIKSKLDQVKVVAVTCLGITSPLLSNKKFDVCIIDEAGQTSLPVSLGPLMFSSKFVLVGDHYQLPPLVKSAEARESGMSVSLFCRLSEGHPQAISALQSQYRMCAGVMKLSNALIYGEKLHCGSPDVENAKLRLSNKGSMPSWLKEVLDADKPVIFINTDILPAFETKDKKTVNNPIEAYIVAEVTEALANHGVEKGEIGIITPYNSQATLIQHILNMEAVEVHTIDKYQGRDKDCIILSFVRSSRNPRNCSSSLLDDWHRINVALTRAKKKLIMVGSCKTLSKVPLLKLLVEKVEEQSGIFSITRKDFEPKPELKRCSHIR